jgi:inorganic pyrophosphatase
MKKEIPTMRSTVILGKIFLCSILVLSQTTYSKTGNDFFEAPVIKDAKELVRVDDYTLKSSVHLVDDIDPMAGENTVRVVVEIPTGSTQKWEVVKSSGDLQWEFRKGKPRLVKYLGYPGNYGMVPRTLLSAENGGDGDPLDVLVLGPAVPRGSVVEVKVIGMLSMLDKGEQDDKLIAVMANDIFDKVDTIKTLDKEFPGVTSIVETWFANYKGPTKIETMGYVGRTKAHAVLTQALDDYKRLSTGAGDRPEN